MVMGEQAMERESELVHFARQELARISKDDVGMQDGMNKHILGMVKLFSDEGHSGFTAGYAISVLNRLLRYLPLSPIEDTAEDWNEVSPGVFRHKRCSKVFKDKNKFNGRAYNREAKIFSNDGGESWFSDSNSREVIEFPYDVPTGPTRYLIDMDGSISPEEEEAFTEF
jgi:hypothetical protein